MFMLNLILLLMVMTNKTLVFSLTFLLVLVTMEKLDYVNIYLLPMSSSVQSINTLGSLPSWGHRAADMEVPLTVNRAQEVDSSLNKHQNQYMFVTRGGTWMEEVRYSTWSFYRKFPPESAIKKQTKLHDFPQLFNHIFLLLSKAREVCLCNEKYVLDQWEAFSHSYNVVISFHFLLQSSEFYCPYGLLFW